MTPQQGVVIMSRNSSTKPISGKAKKPKKPNPDFPLFPHATGRWAKKIKGRMVYFGPWDNPDAALEKYLKEKDALHAGRKPRDTTSGVTIEDLCNLFLIAKEDMVKSGELTKRSWSDYKAGCDLCVQHLGKGRLVADLDPDDFATLLKKIAKRKNSPTGLGSTTLGNIVQRIRVVFKFAFDDGLIDRPVRYGQEFKRPSRKTVRIDRARKGPKLFTAEEVRKLLNGATVQGEGGPEFIEVGKVMRAMVYLGINAGYGNADCGHLTQSVVDLDKGVIDFPRPKTGIPRRAILWPETVQAIREALAVRPEPKDPKHSNLVFITKYGLPWAKDAPDQTLAKEFGKVLIALGINTRVGLGFYALRHTYRTVADETKDQPAVDYTMGHEVAHMSSVYRETISDERLKAVSDYVRKWVFGDGAVA
jgi:integrase